MNPIDFDSKGEEPLNDYFRNRALNFIKGLFSLLVVAVVVINTFLLIILSYKNLTYKLQELNYLIIISAIFIFVFIFFTADRSRSSLILSIQLFIKRFFDVIITVYSIFLLSPFIIIFSILIKLESNGPILFSTKRVGQFGKLFEMLKFRTLYLSKNTPTRIGKFLRKTSLNEFPIFINILNGDISLVGPIPRLFINYTDLIDEEKRILSVRPGIVGLWQISGKSIDDLIVMDLIYVENWSIFKDIRIFIKFINLTIKSLF